MNPHPHAAHPNDFLDRLGKWTVMIFWVLSMGVIVGCGSSGDDAENSANNNSPVRWILGSRYFYSYDDNGQRISEVDDNNANNQIDTGDETWMYVYDSDGLRTFYYRYEGDETDPAGIGTYYYDENDCNWRLEEASPEGTNLRIWTYDVGPDCIRNSYNYEGSDGNGTGAYIHNEDGFITCLTLGTGEYWEYTLDDFSARLYYDFYDANGNYVRYGIYYYDDDGQLVQLDNYVLP